MLLAAALAFRLLDSAGVPHTEVELAGSRATVFAFLAPGCPLSNRVTPVLESLAASYAPRGVRFFAVNAGRSLPFPDLRDADRTLARQLDAKVTPQVVVVDASSRRLYTGRVDDRMIVLGISRPGATRDDLRLALEDILANRPVAVPSTRAAGCAIEFPRKAPPGAPVYSKQIAPILFRHCAPCHRPSGAAPFPLLTWNDAAIRATTLAEVAAARTMPPWLPAPNPLHPFRGERRLPDRDIALLRAWAEAGAPEGSVSETPQPPMFPAPAKPDAEAAMRAPFSVPATGDDLYRCFVIPLPLDSARHVRAFQFLPGAKQVVHHALLFLDRSGAARRRDAETPEPGYPCFGTPGFLPTSALGGWTPGTELVDYPDGGAVTVHPGTDLVLQLHYHPDGMARTDASSVALFFQPDAPKRRMMDVPLGSRKIDIAAGTSRYVVRDAFTLPIDVDATGIIPHAHYLAREMRGWATLPSGQRIDLLHIPRWDFDWQQHYRWVAPIRLPEGTRFEMEFTYDNSDANPKNPFRPVRRVVWGPDSTDEMAGLHLQVMPVRNEDAEELGRALWGKMMRDRLR
ncbi:MAG: hypothetical protein U0Q16_06780 [Bryobacteraceae bacterium]